MLAELIAEDVRPDLIVGVSAGALNRAFLAHNPCADTVTRMATLWSEITTREVLGLSWRSMLGMLGLRDHVASAQGLRNLLLRELPYRSFSETSIPLDLVCTDLITGEEVVISAGEVIEAVIASTAIPRRVPVGVVPRSTSRRWRGVGQYADLGCRAARGDAGDRLTVRICVRDKYHCEAFMGTRHARDHVDGRSTTLARFRALFSIDRRKHRAARPPTRSILVRLLQWRKAYRPRARADSSMAR